jgi:hypothetical protein
VANWLKNESCEPKNSFKCSLASWGGFKLIISPNSHKIGRAPQKGKAGFKKKLKGVHEAMGNE